MQTTLKNLKCPRCGLQTLNKEAVLNALSRLDNDTWVCSDCGTEEAFVDFGILPARVWNDTNVYLRAKYNRKEGSPRQ